MQNQRLNTGLRAPTGYNQQRQVTTINHAFLNMGERPVTQQGMLGIKPTTAGPKRKVISRSYFLVLLKQKISDLTSEIANFREQKEHLRKEIEVQKNLETHHAKLTSEVRELEGTLADYNLAMDKQRSGTRPEDLLNIKEHISLQNRKLRTQVDHIFTERKNIEEKIAMMEDRVAELKSTADLKLNELSQTERQEYRRYEQELREAETEFQTQMGKLEEISRRCVEQENAIRMDSSRLKANQIKEGMIRFEARRADLEDKLSENSLSFEELRSKLMEQVKAEKLEIQGLEKRAKELRKLGEATSKKLGKMINEEKNGNEIDEDQKRKFEVLYQKEREIHAFLESFESLRKKRYAEVEALENGNLRLTESINKNAAVLRKVPDQKDLEQMSKELNFKKQQAESSEETLERVQIEHLQRQEELHRIDLIHETLPERITHFRQVLEGMKKDLEVFENREKEKEELKKKAKWMSQRINDLQTEGPKEAKALEVAEKEYQETLRGLQNHEQYAAFVEAEKQLSHSAQLEASILSFIQIKQNDCDFGGQIEAIMKISKEINTMVVAENK
jgi:intraflagellar transport protein 74